MNTTYETCGHVITTCEDARMDDALDAEDLLGGDYGVLTDEQAAGLACAVNRVIDDNVPNSRVDVLSKIRGLPPRDTLDDVVSDVVDAIGDDSSFVDAIYTWAADALRDGDVSDACRVLRFCGLLVNTKLAHAIPQSEWDRMEEQIRDGEDARMRSEIRGALGALSNAADAAGVGNNPTSSWSAERLARDFEIDDGEIDTSDARAVVAAVAEFM